MSTRGTKHFRYRHDVAMLVDPYGVIRPAVCVSDYQVLRHLISSITGMSNNFQPSRLDGILHTLGTTPFMGSCDLEYPRILKNPMGFQTQSDQM